MKILKRCLRIIVFFSIFFLLLNFLSDLYVPKWSEKTKGQRFTVRGFYAEKPNSLDVLFIGDSNMYRGVSPMRLWEDHGISSYTYAVSSARIWTMYHLMQDALRTQKPKVIVMDTATLFYTKKEIEPERRKSFDNMPLTKVKWNMINDDIFENDLSEKLSYLFPIFRYHDRWHELKVDDFDKLTKDYKYFMKGFTPTDYIAPNKKGWKYMEPSDSRPKMVPFVKEYLDKVIKYTKDNHIPLVMVGLPDARSWSYGMNVSIKEYLEQNDVPYLDLNTPDTGYDWNIDTCDGGVHSNIYGAEKLSIAIGNYLKENYDLTDHRNDSEYQSWNHDLKKYQEMRQKSYKKLEQRMSKQNKNKKK